MTLSARAGVLRALWYSQAPANPLSGHATRNGEGRQATSRALPSRVARLHAASRFPLPISVDAVYQDRSSLRTVAAPPTASNVGLEEVPSRGSRFMAGRSVGSSWRKVNAAAGEGVRYGRSSDLVCRGPMTNSVRGLSIGFVRPTRAWRNDNSRNPLGLRTSMLE